jgi:signal transduction histidine kinase
MVDQGKEPVLDSGNPIGDPQRDERGRERPWALLDAIVSLSGELNLDTVLSRIVDVACDVIGASYAAVGVIDEQRVGLSNFVYRGITEEERERIGRLPVGRGLLGALIDDPRPIRLNDLGEDYRSVGFPPNHPVMKSFLGVPVVSRGQVYGNLYLTEKLGGGPFTEEDERLAIALASQAGVAVQNARLYGSSMASEVSARRRLRELEVVQAIGSALLGELDPTRVLRTIVREALDLMGALGAYVSMPHDDGDRLVVRVAAGRGTGAFEGMEMSRQNSLSDYAMRVLEPVVVSDVKTDQRGSSPIADRLHANSMLVAPLVDRRKAVGALVILQQESDFFQDDDVFIVRRFADLASMALRNARLISSERDRALMEAELQESLLREQLRTDTLHAVIRAQEDERARIARDLHDSAGQAMASILLSLKLAEQAKTIEDMRARLADVRELASLTAGDVRRIAMELRPSVLDDLGLEAAIDRHCTELQERSGLLIHTTIRLSRRLDAEVETVVYRIVQEALTNAVKSADAKRIDIAVHDAGGVIRLTVRDDGHGFDPDQVSKGLGLLGMRERAELLDGKLSISSAPGEGTTVELEVPAKRDSGS